jgi:hypothetical protein
MKYTTVRQGIEYKKCLKDAAAMNKIDHGDDLGVLVQEPADGDDRCPIELVHLDLLEQRFLRSFAFQHFKSQFYFPVYFSFLGGKPAKKPKQIENVNLLCVNQFA